MYAKKKMFFCIFLCNMRFFLYLCAILDKMGILYEKKNFIIANIIFYMRHVLCK